jgi:DNA-binding NtrC family response regulator
MAIQMRILVIDDEQFIRTVLEDTLRREGCEVVVVSNGKEGFDKLNTSSFDCVITDLKMPETDGRDVLRWVREHQPDVDVIMLTGHGEVQAAVEAMRAGASDFLVKDTPFDGSNVLPALERVLKVRTLRQDNLALRHGAGISRLDQTIDCTSAGWRHLMETVGKIAASNAPVLIQGETGSGKEVVARALHAASPRQDHPFLAVNCGAIKGDLLESELFGYEKGAFTGATQSKSGLLAAAEGGTLFLDEIGEMSGAMQVSLLRVLDRREYRQVGGTRTLHANVRFIGATNRELQELVLAGRFRDDLLYRINTVGLRVPPLRERPEDIPLLAQHFLRSLQLARRQARSFSPPALEALMRYSWPGNVRELSNVVERLMLLSPPESTDAIGPEEVASMLDQNHRRSSVETPVLGSLEEVEKGHILRVMDAHGGNETQAARTLNIDYKTLLAKLKTYNLPA